MTTRNGPATNASNRWHDGAEDARQQYLIMLCHPETTGCTTNPMDRTIIRSLNSTVRRPKGCMDCDGILRFHMADGRDELGRSHQSVMALGDDHLEWSSDWTRWTFPIRSHGDDGAGMPALGSEHVIALRSSDVAQARMNLALRRMGLFLQRTTNWLNNPHFEHVRIARAIRSAHVLLSERSSRCFRQKVLEIMMKSGHRVDGSVIAMWRNA